MLRLDFFAEPRLIAFMCMSDYSSDSSLKGQAYHEAGHVVFGVLAGKRLRRVEIGLGDSQADGCAQWDRSLRPEGVLALEQIKPECMTLLAGCVVEDWYCPPPADDYSSHYSDLAQVTEFFRCVPNGSEEEYRPLWIEEIRKALRQDEVKRAIESVAERLFDARSLTGEEATTLVREHVIENL